MEQPGAQPRTLLELFDARLGLTPDAPALVQLRGGRVHVSTWKEWERRSRWIAAGLMALNVEAEDRVAILCRTRPEWAIIDLGVLKAGATSVPIFSTELSKTVGELLADAQVGVVFVEDAAQAQKVSKDLSSQETQVVHVIQVEGVVDEAFGGHCISLEQLVEMGERSLGSSEAEIAAPAAAQLEARRATVGPDTVACISYTPGTEGRQKGVIQTHGNIVAGVLGLARSLPLVAQDRQLLYLPLAQAFARSALWLAVQQGVETAFARGYKRVLEDCRAFEPTYLCGVPRLFSRVRIDIERARERLPRVQKAALAAALSFASRQGEGEDTGGMLAGVQRNLVEQWVMAPVSEAFGGHLRFAICGGAPLPQETGRFYRTHGLEVLEGYGMTETCAASHINHLDDNVFGTVGPPIFGMEARVLEDGEIQLLGPMVSKGYWRRPDESAAMFSEDGWLRTGDLGESAEDGRLKLTGRRRDVIVTANGKAIAPQPIAEAICAHPMIAQVLIHGERRNYLTALVALDADSLAQIRDEQGLQLTDVELARHPAVFEIVETWIGRANEGLPAHETVRKFAILATGLSEEGGDLTPTDGVKRRAVTKRHQALLDSFYEERY
jgi:long-chain acyl-CoA synthetase